MIFIIIAVLAAAFTLAMMASPTRNRKRLQRGADRAHRMNNGKITVSEAEYLRELREQAKMMRCPRCGRASSRPCVRGCRGRIDIDMNWND